VVCRHGCPWYQRFFNEDYFRIYGPRLSPDRTAGEVDGIVELLGLPAGAKILDLCCGHRRHAIPLAERGYQMTGLDLSEVFLRHAREAAEARGVEVRWVRSDMRDVPFEAEFDAVLNLFTASPPSVTSRARRRIKRFWSRYGRR